MRPELDLLGDHWTPIAESETAKACTPCGGGGGVWPTPAESVLLGRLVRPRVSTATTAKRYVRPGTSATVQRVRLVWPTVAPLRSSRYPASVPSPRGPGRQLSCACPASPLTVRPRGVPGARKATRMRRVTAQRAAPRGATVKRYVRPMRTGTRRAWRFVVLSRRPLRSTRKAGPLRGPCQRRTAVVLPLLRANESLPGVGQRRASVTNDGAGGCAAGATTGAAS